MDELAKQSSSLDGLMAHEVVNTENTQEINETENVDENQENGLQGGEEFEELEKHSIEMDLAMQ